MNLQLLAKKIRREIFIFKTKSKNGHLVSCLSSVDILTSLFYDQQTLFNHTIDTFIFSKGHGSPSIYPILADLEYFDKDELNKYCMPDGILKLHSDASIPGCHFVGGSLGNGLGYASGLAFANRSQQIYVLMGDAELYEGAVWESLIFISHHNLTNLHIIIDRNQYGVTINTEKDLKLEPLDKKFEAFNFNVITIDGHNFKDLQQAFSIKHTTCNIVIAKTTKGKGVSYMENNWKYHVIIPSSSNDIQQGLKELS